jgi:hypothetical protein
MKQLLILALTSLLSLAPIPLKAALSADARLYSVSVRFYQGADTFEYFTLNLSTLSAGNNGELRT